MSVNDWVLDAIEEALDARDAEVAADKRKADLEKRLDAKFEAIVAALAATVKIDRTSSAVDG